MLIKHFKLVWCFFLLATSLFATDKVFGPEVGIETAGKDSNWQSSYTRAYASIFYPIEWKETNLLILPRLDISEEHRSQQPAYPSQALTSIGTGLLVLRHETETLPDIFLWTGRYTDSTWGTSPGALLEFMTGAKLKGLWPSSGTQNGRNETLIAARLRKYPGGIRFTPILGRYFTFEKGWYLNVLLPSQVFIGWQDASKDWDLFFGPRTRDIQYIYRQPGREGWFEGFSLELLVGARRKLAGPLHLLLQAGAQLQNVELLEESGNIPFTYTSPIVPWVNLGIQTLFDI